VPRAAPAEGFGGSGRDGAVSQRVRRAWPVRVWVGGTGRPAVSSGRGAGSVPAGIWPALRWFDVPRHDTPLRVVPRSAGTRRRPAPANNEFVQTIDVCAARPYPRRRQCQPGPKAAVTMSRTRKQPPEVALVETSAGLGAAVGVLLYSQSAHHTAPAPKCPAAQSAACMGRAFNNAVSPMVISGVAGLIIGAGLALLAVLLWRMTSTAATRRYRTARTNRTVRRARRRGALTSGPAQAPNSVTPAERPRRQPIAERVRHEVWRRDRATCVDCGSRDRLEFDHIIPVSRGGSNTARNIELRCEFCNGRKGARI
jgi:hypothetical protein